MAKKRLSDEEILAQIPAARKQAKVERAAAPVAVTAHFDHQTRRIAVDLSNGCQFSFPAALGQGLRGASDKDLAQVEVSPGGIGLHWESLDADLLVSSLLQGIFGTQHWMREIGRVGGQVKSAAKSSAARENGKRGGRPRKTPAASGVPA